MWVMNMLLLVSVAGLLHIILSTSEHKVAPTNFGGKKEIMYVGRTGLQATFLWFIQLYS